MNTHRILHIRRNTTEPQQLMLPIIMPPRKRAHPVLFAVVYGTSTALTISIVLFIISKLS
jgi:hypothetical protein